MSQMRPTILLQWKKTDLEGKARFDRACKRYGATPTTMARMLCDAFSKRVDGIERTEVELLVDELAKKATRKRK